MKESALKYRSFGWSVIPLSPGSKVPPKGFEVIPYRSRIASEDEITAWWRDNPSYNIGIITGKISNLLVVDYDRYKEGFDEDKILEYIPDSIVTPSATTPRGGEHQYFTFPTDLTIAADILPGLDFRGEGGYIVAPPSVNGNGKRYDWLLSPFDTPVAPPPLSFINLLKQSLKVSFNSFKLARNMPEKNEKYTSYDYDLGIDEISEEELLKDVKSLLINRNSLLKELKMLKVVKNVKTCYFSTEGRRDQDIFHVATMLQKGGATDEEMRIILNILAEHCQPPFPPSEVEIKIDSVVKRADRRNRNIAQEVRDWSLLIEGVFLLKDCYKMLKLVNPEDQLSARVTLTKMVKEGSIEKYGNMRGMYRTPSNDAPIIDVQSADLEEYDIKFPLSLHEFVKVHKSNIIIIAGESNAGKTALCLNIAKKNAHKKVNYLSSEMQDGTELRIRLDEFDEPLSVWNHVSFKYRSDNFPDVIAPDDLNIIDYLDEGTGGEAYKMTRRIKDISEKLRKGIAVVCIQKSSQKQFGFGGREQRTQRDYILRSQDRIGSP